MLVKIVTTLLKITVLGVLLVLCVGRIFFPDEFESSFIQPVRSLPVIGQVLGVTWDATGQVGPAVTRRTVEFADSVETSNLPINETITGLATDPNFNEKISQSVEKQVQKQLDNAQNIPKDMVEKIEEEVRKEIYKQICTGWLESSSSASSQ